MQTLQTNTLRATMRRTLQRARRPATPARAAPLRQQLSSGAAAASPSSSSSSVELDYYSAWFCPFAHRATLALEHHAPSGVRYNWIEALGWSKKDTEELDENSGQTLQYSWWYHWKHEDLLKHNPEHQLVPTLVTPDGRAVYESILCIEYIDELARSLGTPHADAPWLLPDDLVERSAARGWSERVNRTLCSPYYTILVRSDDAERRAGYELLIKGLERFSAELEKRGGPYFFGEHPSIVDLTLVPWAYRYYVFETCRDASYAIPRDLPALAAYWVWFDAIMSRPSVTVTLPAKDRYLEHIQKYADGSARSKVGNAVRRGVAAHEFDDEIDDHGVAERPTAAN